RVKLTPFLDDRLPEYLAKGWGGHVSWIKPDPFKSGHPTISTVDDAQAWTKKILKAIGQSEDWNKCAVFITFDDYGGFQDHVPPVQKDAFGPGFRVPCLAIGPFARRGAIQHETREFSSILRFCEKLYGIEPMTARDAETDDFSSAFDLTQPPRPISDF